MHSFEERAMMIIVCPEASKYIFTQKYNFLTMSIKSIFFNLTPVKKLVMLNQPDTDNTDTIFNTIIMECPIALIMLGT